MQYKPPADIWQVDKLLQYDTPLTEDDPKYVDTEEGRGDVHFGRIYKSLSVDSSTNILKSTPERNYILFCGHRGCGKTTELKRLSARLNKSDLFFRVFLDATVELDPNNLQYADVIMALANELFKCLEEASIEIDKVFLSNLESWFSERVEKHEKTKAFALEVKSGIKAEVGVPFFAKLFSNITNSFRINSTYKEELRLVIKNSFSEFADVFNNLINAVEAEIEKNKKGRKILFIIDGTDRLSEEDSKRFFIHDSYQLQMIKSNFIYCAPISLLYSGTQVQNTFFPFILPMIKIIDPADDSRFGKGYKVLRDMVYKRVDKGLFDSEETVDYFIRHSGGCPRELLKLLHYAFLRTETNRFDRDSAEKAALDLAADYKRILDSEDYKILKEIDNSPSYDSNSDRIRYLLYNLALLEYNHRGWRRSHPVIRLLDGYKNIDGNPERL